MFCHRNLQNIFGKQFILVQFYNYKFIKNYKLKNRWGTDKVNLTLNSDGVIQEGGRYYRERHGQVIPIHSNQHQLDEFIKFFKFTINNDTYVLPEKGETCGVFDSNIVNKPLQIYMITRNIHDDWQFIGFSDGTRTASRITPSIFAGSSTKCRVPFLQDCSKKQLQYYYKEMTGEQINEKYTDRQIISKLMKL